VAERLGAGYEQLRVLRPGLIYCSISGYGQEGPARDLPGHDINYLGVVGALDPPVEPGMPPRHFITVPVADLAAALFAANAILAALLRRDRARAAGARDGGAYLDVSLAGSALALMSGRLDDRRARMLGGGGYGAFVAADGRALTVACIEDVFWRRLCVALGFPALADTPSWATFAQRRADAERIDALLAVEFARRPRAEWLDLLRAADVPAAPVNTPGEAPDDAYVAASGLLVRANKGADPGWAVRYPARMPGLAVGPDEPDMRRAPALGEHNDNPWGDSSGPEPPRPPSRGAPPDHRPTSEHARRAPIDDTTPG
jgi:crotonobetainyl-CoA:carnitine CoA-transferase CaiB-like acyl-CoA transferase